MFPSSPTSPHAHPEIFRNSSQSTPSFRFLCIATSFMSGSIAGSPQKQAQRSRGQLTTFTGAVRVVVPVSIQHKSVGCFRLRGYFFNHRILPKGLLVMTNRLFCRVHDSKSWLPFEKPNSWSEGSLRC